MRTGLAILTYVPHNAHPDVRSRLCEAIRTLESSGYDGPVFVVDDGSDDEQHREFLELLSQKYNVVRREQNGGICLAKNTCIRVLMELGVEVGFIAEDDIAFRPGWFEPYLQAHAAIPEIHHYSWAWDGYPSGYMRKTPREIHSHTIVQTSRLDGMFLTFTQRVIEEVGGFKPMPGKWGHTHTNWTRRIIKAGLAPYFTDVLHSNEYLTVNQFSLQSSVSNQLKSRWRRTNDRPARDLSQLFFPVSEELETETTHL